MNPQFSYSVTGLNGIARIGDLSSRTFEYVLAEFGGYLKLYGDGGDVIASVDISGQPAFRWSLFQDDCRACSIGVGLDSIELVQCPEPATMMLIGASMAGLGFLRRRTVLPS